MATMWVSEFAGYEDESRGIFMRAAGKPLIVHNFGLEQSVTLMPFDGKTRAIRLFCDGEFHLSYNDMASNKDEKFAAHTEYFRAVNPSDTVSVCDAKP